MRKLLICWEVLYRGAPANSKLAEPYPRQRQSTWYMGSAAQEALWLRQLQAEIGRGPNTLLIYCDNQSAIKLSSNDCYLPRSKHIDIRYLFIKDHVINDNLKFC